MGCIQSSSLPIKLDIQLCEEITILHHTNLVKAIEEVTRKNRETQMALGRQTPLFRYALRMFRGKQQQMIRQGSHLIHCEFSCSDEQFDANGFEALKSVLAGCDYNVSRRKYGSISINPMSHNQQSKSHDLNITVPINNNSLPFLV